MKNKDGETLRCIHCKDFVTDNRIKNTYGRGNGKCLFHNKIVFCGKRALPYCFEERGRK